MKNNNNEEWSFGAMCGMMMVLFVGMIMLNQIFGMPIW